MRRTLSALCVALYLAFPVVWFGCASTPTQQSTGEYVDDAVITAKVKADIGADKLVSLFQISVGTYRGVVQLGGFVDTQEQVDRASALAQKVKGVREVKNNLMVKPK